MTVMNEKKFVEYVLKSGDVGKAPTFTIWQMIKYYNAQGYKPAEIRKKVGAFINSHPLAARDKLLDYLAISIPKACKQKLIEIDEIHITRSEMSKICTLGNMMQKRIAFTLLCYSKYQMLASKKNNVWINKSENELFDSASVKVDALKRAYLLNDLKQQGIIEFNNTVNSVSIRVVIVDNTSHVVLKVKDLRNLGFQYSQYIGNGKYGSCCVCGKIVPIRNVRRTTNIYCHDHEPRHVHTIVKKCPDCGDVFVVPSRAATDRCPRCYEVHRRNAKREYMAKTRSSKCGQP